MTTKYGLFSEPPYLKAGLPSAEDPSKKGEVSAGFKAGSGNKTGKLADATFNPYVPLHSGDLYQDSATRLAAKRASLLESQKSGSKKEDTRIFKPASPCKKSTAPHAGDTYGTISPVFPHIPSPPALAQQQPETALQAKPIYTSPAKIGSYGYNLTTLSEIKGAKGVAGEYEYRPDPLQDHKSRQKESQGTPAQPFKPSAAPSGKPFNHIEYIPAPPAPTAEKVASPLPFKPAAANTSEPFNPPAEHIPSPYGTKDIPEESPEERRKYVAFKPTFHSRTSATPSIMRMNV